MIQVEQWHRHSGSACMPACKAVPSSFLERNFTLLICSGTVQWWLVYNNTTGETETGRRFLPVTQLQADIEYEL